MKTVLIYPFGKESEIIAKHSEQLIELKPICFVGLNGWEHSYEDICHSFSVMYDFKKALEQSKPEVVWFVKFSDNLDFDKFYLPYIERVIERDIEIIIDRDIMQFLDDSIIKRIKYYKPQNTLHIEGVNEGEVLYPIDTPIIYISSFYGELNKTDLLLSIREKLNEYDVAATYISVNHLVNHFGIYNLPDTLLKNDVSDQSKVMMINSCLKKIEENQKTDLLVVSVPGEMFCVSKKFLSHMGFLTYDFFVAARPDILITNLPYSDYSEEEINIIKKMISQRFGVDVDVLCRVNKRLLLKDTELDQKYTYLTVVKENIKEIQAADGIYDYRQDNIVTIVDECLEKLYKYGEVDMI